MSMKINQLEIENVKRIKAVKVEPKQNGLTIIGGNNKQGKTSVLDAIAWALGGDKFKPSQAEREGSMIPPTLHIVMNNGLVVERNMSGADRMKVATAIVRKLNPNCGFVLLDKLEQMDMKTLQEFGTWLEAEGLQAIATRVSTGEECSIIIEDGYVVGQEHDPEPKKTWKAGAF